jgi:signal transduction histidine kinase
MNDSKKDSELKPSESISEIWRSKLSYPNIIILFILFILMLPLIGLIIDQGTLNKLSIFPQDIPIEDISKGWEYAWGDRDANENAYLPGDNGKNSNAEWRTLNYSMNPPGRSGRNIIWLRKLLPQKEWENPALLVSADGIKHTFSMFLEGRMIYNYGGLDPHGEKYFYGIASHLIPLGNDFQGKILTIKVLSGYSHIGIQGKILMGSKWNLIQESVKKDFDTIAICIAIILIGILDFLAFKENPYIKGPISLFGVLAISLGLYVMTLTSIKDIIFFSPLFWFNLYIVSATILPVGLLGYVWQNFRPVQGSFLHRLWLGHIGYSAICQISFLLAFYSILPASTGYFFLNILKWIGMVEMLFVLGIIAQDAFIKNKMRAWICLLGMLPITAFAIHDTLVELGKHESSVSYVPYGVLIFTLSLELLKRHQFIKDQIRLMNYAEQLEINSREKEELLLDLHDDLGGFLTNIKFLSDMAKNNSSIQEIKELLKTISELSRDSLFEISSFMQTLDDDEMNWQIMQAKFQKYGEKLLEPHGMTYSLEANIKEGIKKPTKILFLNLWRIYEEILTNIVKHSKAKKVAIELSLESDKLFLSIKDDGIGFPKDSNTGRGLLNMKIRAGKIGGSITITSQQGTCVVLRIPKVV